MNSDDVRAKRSQALRKEYALKMYPTRIKNLVREKERLKKEIEKIDHDIEKMSCELDKCK